jgi:hypothetical protein
LEQNLGLRYELSDLFDNEVAQGLNRVDLNTMYGGNNNKKAALQN